MPMNQTGKCRSCGAPIKWVKMLKSGKLNPVDAEPTANGNMIAYDSPDGGPDMIGEVLSKDKLAEKYEEGELLFTSHFATCPGAGQHRRK